MGFPLGSLRTVVQSAGGGEYHGDARALGGSSDAPHPMTALLCNFYTMVSKQT